MTTMMRTGFARLIMTTSTTTMSASTASSSSSFASVIGPSKLKLLGPSFTRAFRCLWMLEELHVKYEIDESVRPQSRKARQYSTAGKVPILLHYRETATKDSIGSEAIATTDPLVLTESLAINTYLGDTFGHALRAENTTHGDAAAAAADAASVHPPLHMPRFGTLERVKYDQLLCCILSELDASSLWIHHKHMSPDLAKVFGHVPEIAEPCRSNFAKANCELVKLCDPYLLGPHFTPIDIAYVHCLEWAMREHWNDNTTPEEWPAEQLDPYLALCRDRPAYQRAQLIRKHSLLETKRRQQQQQDRPANPPASSESAPPPSGAASKL